MILKVNLGFDKMGFMFCDLHVSSNNPSSGDINSSNLSWLRNEFDFWKVHGIMNTSGLLQSK